MDTPQDHINPQTQITGRKVVTVSAAILFDRNEVCLARRSEGRAFAGFWEFPGGKVEPAEDPISALRREIFEEFSVEILAPVFKGESWYFYPDRDIRILFYSTFCERNRVAISVHDSIRWFTENNLRMFFEGSERDKIIPPDVPIVEKIVRTGFKSFLKNANG